MASQQVAYLVRLFENEMNRLDGLLVFQDEV